MATPTLVRKRYHERLVLDVIETDDSRNHFHHDVELGLSSVPKSLPPKYFYDELGSRLFERITELEEYYPTRTEAAILAGHGEEMMAAMAGVFTMVELGSGSSSKTRLLLDILARRGERVEYIPIDISPSVVSEFGEQLVLDYPSLHIRGLICDYHHALGALKDTDSPPKLFLFLGSSMGNFTPNQAISLLREVRSAMGPGDGLLLGLDLKKDPAILHRAYCDAKGVTAAFNLNLLTRINEELGGQFDLERFRHLAIVNEEEGRVEMHLESKSDQIVPVAALERSFSFRQGETIHTENSYKFDRQGLEDLLSQSGLSLRRQWLDERAWFSVNLVTPA